MEIAPADLPCSFEVTFDRNDLNVGMSVYDDTGVTPVLVQGPSAMALVVDYTYRAKFTPLNGRSYIIIKAVYTDNTLSVLDSNYSQGSESIIAQQLSGGSSGGCSIVGYVNQTQTIVGYVNC
jgi:hypothetical protein